VIRLKKQYQNCLLSIIGDIEALGNGKKPQEMSLVLKRDPSLQKKCEFWQKKFLLPATYSKTVRYCFVMADLTNEELVWERGGQRKFSFCCTEQGLLTNSPNQKYTLRLIRKHNRFIKYDSHFTAAFRYSQITPNIFLGKFINSID